MKDFYEVIFVVLVYRNLDDIRGFVEQVKKINVPYKVVMVESFFDKECTKKFKEIADLNNCDFLPVKNGGYGYGNNKGIEYVNMHYNYDYIVVCNADIDILDFPSKMPEEFKGKVIAPVINTLTGKNQNPFWAKENNFAEWLMYYGIKKDMSLFFNAAFALFKIQRIIFLKNFNKNKKTEEIIQAPHGSFSIFSKEVIDILGTPYDDKMFLFAEECLLAHRLKELNIKVLMTKRIKIRHHEDGSMGVANVKQYEERKKSVVYYYEKIKEKGIR